MRTAHHSNFSLLALLPCIILSCIICSSPVRADTAITVVAQNFTDGRHEQFQMIGDAVLNEDFIKLTQNVLATAGSAVYNERITLPDDRSFSTYFTFSMKDPACTISGRGADGIAFILKSNRDSLGQKGLGIGYSGIAPSVAVEFDTFVNGEFADPDDNHIGVNFNGIMTSVATEKAPFQLNSGDLYHAWIDFDGARQLLEVRLSKTEERPSTATFSRTLNLPAIIEPDVYIGFTASTGACRELHSIHSFYFNADLVPGGIDVSEDTYVSKSSAN
jgi:hypothetical protein